MANERTHYVGCEAAHIDCCMAMLKRAERQRDGLLDALKSLVEAEWMVTHDWGGDRKSVLDKAYAALAACRTESGSGAEKA